MSLLHISLFGRFHVQRGGQTLTGFDACKAQELFCYLLLFRDRPHPREALASQLWNENATEWPSRCLRKALWQLRAALDSQSEPLSDCILLVEPNWIQLNSEADLWLDVTVFEEAFKRGHGLEGGKLDLHSVQMLREAVSIYRGGLQESWYQDWYLYERERFQQMYLIVLDKLMDYCETHHLYASGLDFGTLILGCECARERTHRRLMRLHYLSGDRTAALRQYEHCVAALEEELGVGPAKRTVELYEQIRTDQLDCSELEPIEARHTSPTAISLLPRVLCRLNQLQAVLGQVQHEIHQDIRTIELAMNDQG